MTPEQKAAIEALKAEYVDLRQWGWNSATVHAAIDRAVSIATQSRETGPDEVERVARAIWAERESGFPKFTRMKWEDGSELAKDCARIRARAAIAAIAAMSPAAEVERLRAALREARKTIRNAWGAVSSGQTLDKDVEGMLRNALTRVDVVLALPAPPAGESTK